MFTSRHLVAAASACVLLATACSTELVRDLDGEQANLAIIELDRAGIAADKVASDDGTKGTFRLTVPRGQLAAAARALAAAELPRPTRLGVQATFGKSSLVPTPLEERARLYGAIAADLERTLEILPAVERARVHLSIDATAALGETPAPPSAAVVLRLRPRAAEPNADELKRVVAKAAAGLDPARIDLVVTRAPNEPSPASAATAAATPGRERSVYLALGALALVLVLSLGLLYASRRLQLEREQKAAAAPSPSKRLQPG